MLAESSRRCRWHGTQLLYCFLVGSLCMAAAATSSEEEQGKRGREVDEQLTDTDQELLPDSLDVRQAVDDWTPSQVAHWLKKEGVNPWHQAQYLAALEDHTIDGHLLLSLHPRDILHALDADMQQERPDDFSRNLELLHGKVEKLRQAIVQNPVDFWEYRVAHRRSAAHILCGLALAPRVTIFYMLVYARETLFLVVGENGLSLLSLVLFIAAPNLAVSLYLSKVVKHAPALLVTMIGSHACIFLGHLASTRGMAYTTVLWDSVKADFYRALILLLATIYFQMASWWLVDVTIYVVIFAQVMYALFMLFLWAKVVKDMKEEMGRRPVIRPARGTVASRNASYAKAPVNSMSSAKSYKRS